MDLHVWTIRLDAAGADPELATALDAEERRRADAFRFDEDRRRFVAAHAFLRAVLGWHLNVAPAALRFAAGDDKPRLVAPGAGLEFNASRSGEVALVGVCSGARIGVDVEFVQAVGDLEGLAATALADDEHRAWSELDPHERLPRFYEAWTRKEALGKAEGQGIEHGPQNIRVPLAPIAPERWIAVEAWGSRWLLSELRPDSQCRACIAVEGEPALAAESFGRCEDLTAEHPNSNSNSPLAALPAARHFVRRLHPA